MTTSERKRRTAGGITSLPEEIIERILELCVASPPFMPPRPDWHQYSPPSSSSSRCYKDKHKASNETENTTTKGGPPRSKTMPTIPLSSQSTPPPVIRTRLAPLLVNKLFNRIGTPLFYGTVLLRSEGQARKLALVLWSSTRPRSSHPTQCYNHNLPRFIHTLILMGSWEAAAGEVVAACAAYGNIKRLDLTVANALGDNSPPLFTHTETPPPSRGHGHGRGLSQVLPTLRTIKHLTLRKAGGNTYLTQKRVGEVVRSVARGVWGWSQLESVYIAFKMSDDSLGTTTTALAAPAPVPPAPAPTPVATTTTHPPTANATTFSGTGPSGNAVGGIPTPTPTGRGQGQRSNSSPSRYMGSGARFPLLRTTSNIGNNASSSSSSSSSSSPPHPSPILTSSPSPSPSPSSSTTTTPPPIKPSCTPFASRRLSSSPTKLRMARMRLVPVILESESSSDGGNGNDNEGEENNESEGEGEGESALEVSPTSTTGSCLPLPLPLPLPLTSTCTITTPSAQQHAHHEHEFEREHEKQQTPSLPKELDSAGPCTVLAWSLANCVSRKLHTVVTHTPAVWNGVLVRVVEGRERYLECLVNNTPNPVSTHASINSMSTTTNSSTTTRDANAKIWGLKRVVLVDGNTFGFGGAGPFGLGMGMGMGMGVMEDFEFLGRAFGNGASDDEEESDNDDEEDEEGDASGSAGASVGGVNGRSRGDTISSASMSMSMSPPFSVGTPTTPTPITPRSPSLRFGLGAVASGAVGVGGGGGLGGGLFRNGAKEHRKLAKLIRKGDAWLGRRIGSRVGSGCYGVGGGVGVGAGQSGFGGMGMMEGGSPSGVGYPYGVGVVGGGVRTRAYTMGSTSSGVSG